MSDKFRVENDVWEMKIWEELTCCIDVVLALCNMDIEWTQKRPVAIVVLVIVVAAALNFTALHLMVWPQTITRSYSLSISLTIKIYCWLICLCIGLLNYFSLFNLNWKLFLYVPAIYFCSLKFLEVLLVTDPSSSLRSLFPEVCCSFFFVVWFCNCMLCSAICLHLLHLPGLPTLQLPYESHI